MSCGGGGSRVPAVDKAGILVHSRKSMRDPSNSSLPQYPPSDSSREEDSSVEEETLEEEKEHQQYPADIYSAFVDKEQPEGSSSTYADKNRKRQKAGRIPRKKKRKSNRQVRRTVKQLIPNSSLSAR